MSKWWNASKSDLDKGEIRVYRKDGVVLTTYFKEERDLE